MVQLIGINQVSCFIPNLVWFIVLYLSFEEVNDSVGVIPEGDIADTKDAIGITSLPDVFFYQPFMYRVFVLRVIDG